MAIKNTPQYQQLKEAMALIRELKIPEHLQQKALEHLLQDVSEHSQTSTPSDFRRSSRPPKMTTGDLRDFINACSPKGACAEIPALLYWLKTREQKLIVNENDILGSLSTRKYSPSQEYWAITSRSVFEKKIWTPRSRRKISLVTYAYHKRAKISSCMISNPKKKIDLNKIDDSMNIEHYK